jgi:hypothetical protein
MHTVALPLALFAVLFIGYTRPFALAIYRRLQGSEVHTPRALEVTTLLAYEAFVWALVAPWTPLWAAFGGIYIAAICLWFVYGHPNAGNRGEDAVKRYWWAGLGYRWAYPVRSRIPEYKLLGWTIVKPQHWTEAAELFLGWMTAYLTTPLLICLLLAKCMGYVG